MKTTRPSTAATFAAGLMATSMALAQQQNGVARTATYEVRTSSPPAGSRAVGGSAPTQIVVTGDGAFPARARDPVLHVGAVTLRNYRYGGDQSRVLTFAVPAGTTLVDGAPIFLQYEPGDAMHIDMGVYRAGRIAP